MRGRELLNAPGVEVAQRMEDCPVDMRILVLRGGAHIK
jgi:hypothetical protein